ncbi:hypothetical protein [Thermomonas sp. HDW16]|uniref:hypothetical protein n=1 Tax=Thermomonas sp. HDW16 TaxID=2714945 RepID=UPI00140CB674|nr:hypothetical protein [Thermomonas sp. HDW16]QIL21062.1 hypothetical protein G7079_10170 [Thermomonas sp. HDW16]
MMKILALLAGFFLLLSAFLLNSFYTDLRTRLVSPSDRFFLVSWQAPSSIRKEFIDKYATKLVKPGLTERKLNPEYSKAFDSHFDRYCKLVGNGKDWRSIKTICSREFSFPGPKWITQTTPEVTFEDGRDKANSLLSRMRLKQGLAPSFNTSDSNEISQSAMARAFWLGVFLPLSLVALSIGSILLAVIKCR